MGRFYKTTDPQMIDFMYKAPEQSIMAAIKGVDTQLGAQEQYLTDLQKQLQVAALEKDRKKRDAKVAEIEAKIKEHTLNIYNNPLSALKEKQKIRDLGQEIHKDLTRGELFAYQSNYNTRQKFYEDAVKRSTAKDGTIRLQDVDAAMSLFDAMYNQKEGANYDPETGKYNPYGVENLVNYFDANKFAIDTAQKMKTHKSEEWKVQKEGRYWFEYMEAYDVLGLDEATAAVYSNMLANDDLVDWYGQQIQFNTKRLVLGGMDPKDAERIATDKYYGERNEDGSMKMEAVIGEDGKPKTYVDEKGKTKTVMKPVNPGILFEIAQAGSDLFDINDSKKKRNLKMADQFDLQENQHRLNKNFERFKKELEAPTVFDNKTGTVTKQILNGTNLAQIKTKLEEKNKTLTTSVTDYKTKLLGLIANQNLSAAQLKEVRSQLNTFLNESNPDWKGLKEYLANNTLKGFTDENGVPIATGIEKVEKAYNANKVMVENEKAIIEKIEKDTEERLLKSNKLPEGLSTQARNNTKSQINQLKIKVEENKKLMENPQYRAVFGSDEEYKAKLKELEKENAEYDNTRLQMQAELKRQEIQYNAIITAEAKLNPTTSGSSNRASMQIFSIGGDIWKRFNVPAEQQQDFTTALETLKKNGIIANIQDGSNAVYTDKNGVVRNFSTNEFIGTLFKDKPTRTQDIDKNGDIVVKVIDGDKTREFKYKVHSTRVTRDDVSDYNRDGGTGVSGFSYQYIIEGVDPKTNQQVSYTVNVPTSEISNVTVDNLMQTYNAELQYENFINEAETMTSTSGALYKDPRTNGRVAYDKNTNSLIIYGDEGGSGSENIIPVDAENNVAMLTYKEIYNSYNK